MYRLAAIGPHSMQSSKQATLKLLPDSVALQYSELMQQCVRPLSDGSNLSFKSKSIKGRTYWYLYISLGSRRSEHYLGADSSEMRARIENEKSLWESSADDRDLRARLVAMLLAGGATTTPTNEGKVMSLLERGGVFLAGGVVVGTLAFRAYANMLGVRWASDLQTRDIDIATDNTFRVAVNNETPVDLTELLMDSGMGFLEVPALNRKSASTEFTIKRQELAVELLTPMTGKNSSQPVKIDALGSFAEPVRYLDYLLEDVQPAVLLFKHGVLVNVPSPARYAFHKLVVSQRRPIAMQEKIKRDIAQANQLFQVLLDVRPFDITQAATHAKAMGAKFEKQMLAGIKLLPEAIATELAENL